MTAAPKKLEWTAEALLGQVRKLPQFETLTELLAKRLSRASEVIELAPDREILRQGQMNKNLFILIAGAVGVYVDGGRVSKLSRAGDLLGEMSVISNTPVGATLIAETAVTILRVDVAQFLESDHADRDAAQVLIYRLYAGVLAQKLGATNEKAKHFELLNIRLHVAQTELERANAELERKVEERTARLEQQNLELQASKLKIEEVLHGRRVVFQKLSALQHVNLIPLKTFLDEVRKRFPGEAVINDARDQVFEVQQILRPLTDQYSSEQAVQGKRVLLADAQKKQQVVARLAMGGTGVALDIATDLDEAKRFITDRDYDLVVIDGTMVELGNVARARNPEVDVVLLTSDSVPTFVSELRRLERTPHIVSRDEADRTFTVKNLATTVTKVLSRDLFGLEKYLAWGCDIQRLPITGSRQRADVLKEAMTYFESIGIRRANRDRIHAVVEEMLMNAIYDAPVGADGRPLFNHLPRSEHVILKPEQQGLVRFATDGNLVAVSVQDPFGALRGETLINYLEKNYLGRATEAHGAEDKAGAGRGLHQIVENSDLAIFNVDPGKSTEVIALFNVEVKERAPRGPSFHLFIRD